MERYLLFDSGCSICSDVASKIERESVGWIQVRSLRDPGMQNLLNQHQPGWSWEPTIVEIDNNRVQIFTGRRMQMYIVRGLGLRRSWRIARMVNQARLTLVPERAFSSPRRRFLHQTNAVAGLLFFPGLTARSAQSSSLSHSNTLQLIPPNEINRLSSTIKSSPAYRLFLSRLSEPASAQQAFAIAYSDVVVVTIPFMVANMSERAFFTATLSSKGYEIGQIRETLALYRTSVQHGTHIHVWADDSERVNAVIDPQGNVLDGWIVQHGQRIDMSGKPAGSIGERQADATLQRLMQQHTNQPSASLNSISIQASCYETCSGRCSIPQDIAAAAALICAALCGASLGTGCVACATVAAGFYAYNVACCLYKCSVAPAMPCCGGF